MLQIAGYNGENVAQSGEEAGDSRSERRIASTSRPPDKVRTVMLKGRNVDDVRNTSNHVTQSPSVLMAEQAQLHSSIHPPSSSSSAGCMYHSHNYYYSAYTVIITQLFKVS